MLISAAKMALSALEASSTTIKLAIAAGLAIAVVTIYGLWHHEVFHAGYTKALADIAAEDSQAIERATGMRATWQACRARNGRWDQATGACQ
jgi:hypothetical protein